MRIPWKKLSGAFMWIAALSMCVLPAAQSEGAEAWRVYIGGYHSDENFGINYGTYDPANGALKMEGKEKAHRLHVQKRYTIFYTVERTKEKTFVEVHLIMSYAAAHKRYKRIDL